MRIRPLLIALTLGVSTLALAPLAIGGPGDPLPASLEGVSDEERKELEQELQGLQQKASEGALGARGEARLNDLEALFAGQTMTPAPGDGPPAPPAPEGEDGASGLAAPGSSDTDVAAEGTLPPVDSATGMDLPPEEIPEIELDPPETYKQRMENAMADMGDLVGDSEKDDDLVRVSCIQDKSDRASAVLVLGTTELMITRDDESSDIARHFAHQKLAVAAERVEELVEEARGCSADILDERASDNAGDSEEGGQVGKNDATKGYGSGPNPNLPPNGSLPPVASPVS